MEQRLINNTEWLAGYAAYERGERCPHPDDYSARLGWMHAKDEKRLADADAGVWL